MNPKRMLLLLPLLLMATMAAETTVQRSKF